MGINSPNLIRRRVLTLLAAPFVARLANAQKKKSPKEGKMTQAEAVIDQYRHGGEFQPQTQGFTSGASLIPLEIETLAAALLKEPARVREQIVRLLVDLGRRADPLFSRGAAILRDPHVVTALAGPALYVNDAARDNALSLIHEFVPASGLAPHGQTLTADFEKFPSTSSFLVLAKAKPAQAKELVRKVAVTPRWKEEVSARIALAAFGDKAEEQRFSVPFASTQDPTKFSSLAQEMGWIGTPTTLKALADQVRTGLIFEVPNTVRRSLRLEVVGALSFNFPEEPALFRNSITSEQSYEAVEKFCQQHFGTRWSKPRPEFLADLPFPR